MLTVAAEDVVASLLWVGLGTRGPSWAWAVLLVVVFCSGSFLCGVDGALLRWDDAGDDGLVEAGDVAGDDVA